MNTFCLCRCHRPPDVLLYNVQGVPLTDVLEAAVACPGCVNAHTAVFAKPVPVARETTPWVDSTANKPEEHS